MLMEKGWTLPEIDGMDICWFCRLMGRTNREKDMPGMAAVVTDEQGNRGMYIDQFGLF
jgi:hypothetical protein